MHGTDESEMSDIRKDIEEIIKNNFPPIPVPASWLMFRIVLHLLNKPIVSLAQCKEIAKQLSMPTPVEEALWFFHHDVGSLMHYSKIPSMEDIVVCNPQVIFDSISELIIDNFQYGNRALKPCEVDEFIEKGQFSLSHIKEKTKCQQGDLLTLSQLVDVLKHHNILVEIKEEQISIQHEPKFLMPTVLKYASEEDLKLPMSSDCEQDTSPLMIQFQGGFVPFGIFCTSISHLIAHQDSMSPKWKVCREQVKRNKVQFSIDGSFVTTLISRAQYLEIRIEQPAKTRSKLSITQMYSIVRQTVVEALETVISKMKYKPFVHIETPSVSIHRQFDFAFSCCLDDSHGDHLMKVHKEEAMYFAECLKDNLNLDLKPKHLVWFNQVSG